MISVLDAQLFPDQCIVLNTGKELIFPIFRNGSSSINHEAWPAISKEEIAQAKEIIVFVREPYERFLSGVTAYLEYHHELEADTVIQLINQHLFLDRHFCPQFYWLMNLQRYTDAHLKILDIKELSNYTKIHVNKMNSIKLNQFFKENQKLHFYLAMDKVLYWDLKGQTVPFSDVVYELKMQWPEVYREVIERSKTLCSVLD